MNYFPLGVAENVENFTFLCSSRGCIKKELFVKFSLISRYCCWMYGNMVITLCTLLTVSYLFPGMLANLRFSQQCSSWPPHIWSTCLFHAWQRSYEPWSWKKQEKEKACCRYNFGQRGDLKSQNCTKNFLKFQSKPKTT